MTNFSEIAWPGPRPLDPNSSIALAGRERELEEIAEQTRTYDVIQITAPSGVGKTSFIEAGLRPMLAAAERYVPDRMLWPKATAGIGLTDVTPAVAAERVYRKLVGADPLDDELDPYDALLKVANGRRTVVVLDQYEELLRYQRTLGQELLRVVARTARDTRMPHIVISRSEWVDDLRPLEAAKTSLWPMRLGEVTQVEALRNIVENPAKERGVDFEPEASLLIAQTWLDARSQAEQQRAHRLGADAIPVIGLLHFHALLRGFARWGDAEIGDFDGTVRVGIVKRFLASFTDAHAASDLASRDDDETFALWLCDHALESYVGTQITTALRDELEGDLPDGLRWRNGPALLLARITPMMRSAGFKLPQSLLSLVPLAVTQELTPGPARSLARKLETVDDITKADQRQAMLDAEFRDKELGAGVGADWSDAEVVGEMLRALCFALERVSEPNVNVLRQFVGSGQPVYELVHDGMGPALSRWASDFIDSDVAQIGTIAGQPGSLLFAPVVGQHLRDLSEGERGFWGISGTNEADRVVLERVGRPQSLIVSKEISDVVFERADFSGAMFKGTHFRNVVFKDCKLVSTLFRDCVLDDVRFVTENDDAAGQLNLLTIRFGDPTVAVQARVRFIGLPTTTGVFLEGINGGEWEFSKSEIRSLVVVTADKPTADAVFKTTESTVLPLAVYGPGVVRREPPDDPGVTVVESQA